MRHRSFRSAAAWLGIVVCLIPSLAAQRRGGQGANVGGGAAGPNRITGRITGANGLPLRSVIVSLLEKHQLRTGAVIGLVNAQLRVVPNERGDYSISSGPGTYYVVAIPVHDPAQANGKPMTSGHAVTYFPNVTDIAKAQEITVTMSKPVVANISLRAAPLVTVSGTAKWSDGMPAASGRVSMSSDNHLFGLDGRSTTLERDGTFRIPAVAPGKYCIQHVESGGRGQRRKVSVAKLTVADRDLTAVRVVPLLPTTVKGRVIPAAADRERLRSLAITVGASPAAGGCYFGAGLPGTVQPNGTFELQAEPMDGYVRVWVNREEIRPAAVRHAAAEVPNGRFTFARGTPLNGVEIVLPPLPPSIGK